MFKGKGKHRKPRVGLAWLASGFAPLWLAAILLAFEGKRELEAASAAQFAGMAQT